MRIRISGKICTFLALLMSVLLLLCSCGKDTGTAEEKNKPVKTEATQSEKDAKEDEDSGIPSEYKSALKKAKSYIGTMPMSKKGLYEQLTSEYGEKFSDEAAQYAIDNIDVDWKEQALKCAESYVENLHQSKLGLYEQLTSEYGEEFTEEEAQYALDNIDADWREAALESAKSYRDTLDMSPSEIYDQLTSEFGEQFTEEEAQYAIDHLDD